jgi:hypothetical protein
LNFEALVKFGTISPDDLKLFQYADDVDTAFQILHDGLTEFYLKPEKPRGVPDEESPAIARSNL